MKKILYFITIFLISAPCYAADDGWDMLASDKLQHAAISATSAFMLSSWMERQWPEMNKWKRVGIASLVVISGAFLKEVRDESVGDIISESDLVANSIGAASGALLTIRIEW